MKRALLIGAAVLAAANASQAAVVVNTHNRFVEAEITNMVISDSELKTAPDANPFNETAIADIMFQGTQSTMRATQTSDFAVAANVLTVNSQSLSESKTQLVPGGLTGSESMLEITFTVDSNSTYSLTGDARVFGAFPDPGFYMSYIIRLEDSAANVIFDFRDESLPPMVFSDIFAEAGALAPDTYKFIARTIGGGVGNVDESAELDIQFIVNSPGGGPGGGGNPQVPLPAAGWVGMALGSWVLGRKSRR